MEHEVESELFDIVCRALCCEKLQDGHDLFENAWIIRHYWEVKHEKA